MAFQSSSMTNLCDVVVETIHRPMLYSKKTQGLFLVFIATTIKEGKTLGFAS
jgi:hypothetical protein